MGQVLSAVDQCFQPDHIKKQNESSSIPAPKTPQGPAAPQPPQPKVEKKPAAPSAPANASTPTEAPKAAPAPATVPTDADDLPLYTNRPEDLDGYPKASGTFVKRTYEAGVLPDCSNLPALTGEFVTDGKVSFDKAALSIPGVFPTRAEELAQQQKAIDLKKDAAAATAKANDLHGEANKLYEAGDHDGNKAKMAESKVYRAKAQEIHQESFDLAYDCAMSQAFKALYSKLPSVDYHVFLLDPYEKSYRVAIEMMKKYRKFNRKDFMIVPGEGQHSTGKPVIPPHFQNWLKEANIQNEQITSGSFALILDSCPPL